MISRDSAIELATAVGNALVGLTPAENRLDRYAGNILPQDCDGGLADSPELVAARKKYDRLFTNDDGTPMSF